MFRLGMDHMKEIVLIMWLREKSEDSKKVQRAQRSEEGQYLGSSIHDLDGAYNCVQGINTMKTMWGAELVSASPSLLLCLMFCFPFIISSKILKNKKVFCVCLGKVSRKISKGWWQLLKAREVDWFSGPCCRERGVWGKESMRNWIEF